MQIQTNNDVITLSKKALKDFQQVTEFENDQYILGVNKGNDNLGLKITAEDFRKEVASGSVSSNTNNALETDDDDKLFVNDKVGALNSLNTQSKTNAVSAINEVNTNLGTETTNREEADANLQEQIDEIISYGGANNDLSNLSTTGEKHFLNKTHVPNCILEKPHKINLELSSGNLTLKSGSTVIIPNGFESNGTTPKFDYLTLSEDRTLTGGGAVVGNYGFCITSENYHIGLTSEMVSGSSEPTATSNRQFWYDTANNVIKTRFADESWSSDKLSFPIGIFERYQSGTSYLFRISQTFDGIGYIGSTIWVDKGIKATYPNGKNADGTLKNVEFTTSNVLLKTSPSTYYKGTISFSNNFFSGSYTPDMKYDIETNYNRLGGVIKTYGVYGNFETDGNNKITSFNVKDVFRAMDYTDKNLPQIDGQWVQKFLSANSSTVLNTYTIDLSSYLPNDGYNYEVFCRIYVSRNDTSGTNTNLSVGESGSFTENNILIRAVVDGANWQSNHCTGILTVDTSRKIYKQVAGYKPEYAEVYLYKYRRLGTNN